ncbi:unnamed protein product [Adineta ricciae]|uniref:Uncharacterized protein n=1 Tax=Adineta ricciae TaxID=249248 RepID=A0A814FRE7_ADIRI|nr:unnamed protein product [Adineta ricciae]
MTSTAVCFLTVRPMNETLEFADRLARAVQQDNIDVFVMVDDNSFKVPSSETSIVKLVQISNKQCVIHGYQHIMYVYSKPIQISSWDKSLLYFSKLNTNYSFVWLLENDLFIPSVGAFRAIHELYSNTSDLIVKRVDPNFDGNQEASWPHWKLAYGKLPPPWFESMTNAVGFSRRFLKTVDNYIRWRGIGTFHEYFFQTLGFNENMTVVSPTEFDTLVWRRSYSWQDIERNPSNWWHPVKNLSLHDIWRNRLLKEAYSINNTIHWTQLKSLCSNQNNTTSVQTRLQKLIFDFGQHKIHLTSQQRRSLRQHFLCLAQQCQVNKDLISATSIIENLADSAYKLPEPIRIIIFNKSSLHLQLEEELVQNKEHVFRTTKYAHVVKWFRELATNLTILLTNEIQREMKQAKIDTRTNKLDVLNGSLEWCAEWSSKMDSQVLKFSWICCAQIQPQKEDVQRKFTTIVNTSYL